jgi:putative spermidine/putrescine transport system substrate-binding protein
MRVTQQLFFLILFTGLAYQAPTEAKSSLKILAWEGYADADLVAEFAQRQDLNVEVSYAYSDDELWDMANNPKETFDLIAVNTAELQRYIKKGLVRPIDLEKIPNIRQQLPRFQQHEKIPGLVSDQKTYAIPYTFSEMGLIYNRLLIETPPTSINILWDKRYAGKVLAFNTSTHNFTLAALSLGFQQPFSLSKHELSLAAKHLVELRRNVLTFYSSPQEAVKLFKNHKIAIIYANYGTQQLKALRDVGADIAYSLPVDGTLAWLDCWAISKTSHNHLAESWIDFTLEEKMAKRLSNTHGLANTIIQSPVSLSNTPLIWLEPIKNTDLRNSLWEQVMAGDMPERF